MAIPLCYPHSSGSYLSLEAPAPLRKALHWPLGAPFITLSLRLLAAGHFVTMAEGCVRQHPQRGTVPAPLPCAVSKP